MLIKKVYPILEIVFLITTFLNPLNSMRKTLLNVHDSHFNLLVNVWKCDKTLSLMFDLLPVVHLLATCFKMYIYWLT